MIKLRDIARSAVTRFGAVLTASYATGATVGLFMSPTTFEPWALLQAGTQVLGMSLGYAASLIGLRRHLRSDAAVSGRTAVVAAVGSILTLVGATLFTQGVPRLGMLWVSFLCGAVVTAALYAPWIRVGVRRAVGGEERSELGTGDIAYTNIRADSPTHVPRDV